MREGENRVKAQEAQLMIYPTPAKSSANHLIQEDLLTEIEKSCVYLSAFSGDVLGERKREEVRNYFKQYFSFTDATYHLELCVRNDDLSIRDFWEGLHMAFPQFAWIRCQKEKGTADQVFYLIDFVPMALQSQGFAFYISLDESLKNHFSLSARQAKERMKETILQLADETRRSRHSSAREGQETKGYQTIGSTVSQSTTANTKKPTQRNDHRTESKGIETREALPDEVPVIEPELLVSDPDEKRIDGLDSKRLQSMNKRLEMMVEKLEVSMIQNGIKFFSEPNKVVEGWHKWLTISLREYTYLMQKAKFLEQMWNLNGNLVSKSEKMTITGNTLVYERDQIKEVKAKLSTQDIHFVLYECQMIESRSKVRARPWFRKPYVKMLKMDYDNLVSKATYFDLLQGESYLLEKMIHENEEPPSLEEVG